MPANAENTLKKRSVHFDSSVIDNSDSPSFKQPKQAKHHGPTAFISSFTKPHPLGVRPSGNALLCADRAKADPLNTLGPLFGKLSEPLLMTILQEIESPDDLLHLGHTCKAMFAYTWSDELWKHIVYRFKRNPSKWYGTWRRTYWEMTEGGVKKDEEESTPKPSDEAVVDCKGIVFSDLLYRPFQCSQIDYKRILMRALQDDMEEEEELQLSAKHKHPATRAQLEKESKTIPIMNEADMTLDNYNSKWHSKPFMLNLESPIATWTVEGLVERFGETVFRQEFMDWKLKVYYEYMNNNNDESPLYLFDCRSEAMRSKPKHENRSDGGEEARGGELSNEYRLPGATFTGDGNDVFTVLGNVRPDHRWLILGPERSGSSFHKDPNATTAWNVVLSGHKYWIMFPPSSSSLGKSNSQFSTPPGIATDEQESEVTAPVSIAEWFASGYYDQARQTPGFCHGICGPGQMMHVPSGWWHLVVNLDQCLALTGNFVPVCKIPDVMDFLHNKHDQISGFKWRAVEKELVRNYVLESGDAKKTDKVGIEGLCDSGKVKGEEEEEEDEDCSSSSKSADISRYVFYLFISKILQSGNSSFIASLHETFARLPLLMLYREKMHIKQQEQEKQGLQGEGNEGEEEHGPQVSKMWTSLVGGEDKGMNGHESKRNEGEFSFGFSIGDDDLDVEVP